MDDISNRSSAALWAILLCCHLAVTFTPVQGQRWGQGYRISASRIDGAAREKLRIGVVVPLSSFVRGYWRSLSRPINDINRRMTFPERYSLETTSVTLGMMEDESSPMGEWTERITLWKLTEDMCGGR